jgi:hypothetical protein
MGDSMPPPATFDLVDSCARRRGSDVEIVLGAPKTELNEAGAVIRLTSGKRSVDANGQLVQSPTGPLLTVRAPRDQFVDGIWSMTTRADDDRFVPLAARLLVQGDRPLVLLWGAKAARTELPPARGVRAAGKRRAAAVGGRALDGVLAVLPDERARTIRQRARRVARRVLG